MLILHKQRRLYRRFMRQADYKKKLYFSQPTNLLHCAPLSQII